MQLKVVTAKRVLLWLTLALGTYALWPEGSGEGAVGSWRAGRVDYRPDARFVLKVAPGQQYNVGTVPSGLGQPVRAFATVVERFEERFPDTRIDLVVTPNLREYLVTQLSSGSAPDVVYENLENVWVDVQKGWYIPLDRYLEAPNPFVVERGDASAPGYEQWWDMFKYQAISRGKAAPDGKMYCFTLDMVETGLYYNKSYFEEHGWKKPDDWAEFIELQKNIQEAGKIPLLVGQEAYLDWGFDLILDQLYFEILPGIDLLQDPIREPYLEGYLDAEEIYFLSQKGFFTRQDPRYRELYRLMRELRGYMNRDMSARQGYNREFVSGAGAMLWASSQFVDRLVMDKNLGFEWGVFYLPPIDKETSELAAGVEMCVIGGAASQWEVTNSAIRDTDARLSLEERMERSERLKRVIAFLQFLSLPENAELVVNERPRFIPNIVGVEPRAELQPFVDILERRYTTTKWVNSFDLRFRDTMHRTVALYLEGGIDLEGVLKWQEESLQLAGSSLHRRQKFDMGRMERRWQELAPVRASYEGLPSGLLEGEVSGR